MPVPKKQPKRHPQQEHGIQRDLSYKNLEGAEANGLTLDDLDSDVPSKPRPASHDGEGPAEGADIG